MSWVKATLDFVHAWRYPDKIAREVEAELRFHIEMRARANIEGGMRPDEAELAALQSFGDFDSVKISCCEISRSLSFDSRALRMGLHITVACLAGGAALWAVNVPHHTFMGVLRQLVAIIILTYLFVVVRRARSAQRFARDRASGIFTDKVLVSDICEERSASIASHDEQGRTPIERMFNSD